ncbi:MAG: glucose-6-phosphate dehydrogenase assembly protein OpcA [Roseimicrobium sp.]
MMNFDTSILGQEVPLGKVDKALKELWGKDDARTKASLMNFAIYSEDPASIAANTRLLGEITQEHACRGLLILVLPSNAPPSARAWITAHCQLHEGHKSICSEQVSFVLNGGTMNQVRNIVFAHLDSDLPLITWWQGDLTSNFDERFYSVMDLLFVDSAQWLNPARDFAMLHAALSERTAKFRTYDLSWLRSHLFRTAIASCFADAPARAELQKVTHLEITHCQGQRVSGLLLAAWIGVRLKCSLETVHGGIRLVLPDGRSIEVTVREAAGSEALQRVTLRSDDSSFSVFRDCGASYLCTKVVIGSHHHEQMLPADLVSDAALITEQLSRLGGQSLYQSMLPMLRGML